MTDSPNNAQQLLPALIEQMGQALVSSDIAALDQLWAEGYVFTAPIGMVLSKAQRLDFVRSGRRPLQSLEYTELTVHRFGETAVVTGRYSETARNGATGETGLITVVFALLEQGWQMVAGHNSTLIQ